MKTARPLHLTARTAAFVCFAAGLFCVEAAPVPQPRLHAHNDYLHTRPLLDALECGFCSVEADVYLVEGQLLVAHDRSKVQPTRTLQALYLEPLRQRVERNGGRVYPGGPELTLLIDLKQPWNTTYPVLREVLRSYSGILSTFAGTNKTPKAVTVILTGNRAPEIFAGETPRFAALDGTLADLDSNPAASLVPLVSTPWYQVFKWRGTNSIPDDERLRLRGFVTRAHAQGRRLRFWGAPDNPVFWAEMLASGVDLINTDRLKQAQEFMVEKSDSLRLTAP